MPDAMTYSPSIPNSAGPPGSSALAGILSQTRIATRLQLFVLLPLIDLVAVGVIDLAAGNFHGQAAVTVKVAAMAVVMARSEERL